MITPEDRKKYENYTDKSILGIKLIGGLDNNILRAYISEDVAVVASLRTLLGDSTNPNWIKSRIADEMYDRDMIDEKEYDYLSR